MKRSTFTTYLWFSMAFAYAISNAVFHVLGDTEALILVCWSLTMGEVMRIERAR